MENVALPEGGRDAGRVLIEVEILYPIVLLKGYADAVESQETQLVLNASTVCK